MSRRPNTDQRRAEIAAALGRVIAREGYERATIQRIAAEAGLAPGLIHYHFATKREVLVHYVASLEAAARERFTDALAALPAGAARARLHAYLRARLGLGPGADPQAVAAWVMIGAEAVRQPEVREIYQRIVRAEVALLTTLVTQAAREGGGSAKGARRVAAGLAALSEGAFQLASAAGEAMPKGYALEAALAMVDGAIGIAGARS